MSKSGLIAVVAAVLIAIVYVEIRLAGFGSSPTAPAAPADTSAIDARLDRIEEMLSELKAAPPSPFESDLAPPQLQADVTEIAPDNEPEVAPTPSAEKTKRLTDFLARVEAGDVVGEEMNELWNILSGTGRYDEALSSLVKNAKARPNDADAQYGVGIGAISKLVSGQISFAEQSQLSMLADAAFNKALAIDDHHFGARFSKAVSYTFWPEAMGKGPAAIAEFETLRKQAAQDPSIPMLEGVYTNLGIQYRKSGNREKSRAALEEGLRMFPDSEEIREQLRSMGD